MKNPIQILIHIKKFIEESVKYINSFIEIITYNLIELSSSFSKINNNDNENFISQSHSPTIFKNAFTKLHSQSSKGQ